MGILKKIDELIEKNVKHYKSDWYELDRPRAEKCGDKLDCVIATRKTGTDTLFMAGEPVSYSNVNWFMATLDTTNAGSSVAFYRVTGDEIFKIKRDLAVKLSFDILRTLPDEYIRYCNDTRKWPTLQNWRKMVRRAAA